MLASQAIPLPHSFGLALATVRRRPCPQPSAHIVSGTSARPRTASHQRSQLSALGISNHTCPSPQHLSRRRPRRRPRSQLSTLTASAGVLHPPLAAAHAYYPSSCPPAALAVLCQHSLALATASSRRPSSQSFVHVAQQLFPTPFAASVAHPHSPWQRPTLAEAHPRTQLSLLVRVFHILL